MRTIAALLLAIVVMVAAAIAGCGGDTASVTTVTAPAIRPAYGDDGALCTTDDKVPSERGVWQDKACLVESVLTESCGRDDRRWVYFAETSSFACLRPSEAALALRGDGADPIEGLIHLIANSATPQTP
ncbi:MAG TPA: hypothetical protein VMY78_09845 [Solirubrobacteraceae bacterium]|nr:hypothetical protein [Solirubrobacteraceae bacterium]